MADPEPLLGQVGTNGRDIMAANAVEDRMPAAFWRAPLLEIQERLGSGPAGLTSREAAARLARFGPNSVETARPYSLFFKILARFRNPLVLTLLVASEISAATGDL